MPASGQLGSLARALQWKEPMARDFFPIPLPDRPLQGQPSSGRLRTRRARRMRVWRRARGLIELMNGLDCGSLEARPTGQRDTEDDEKMLAWKLVQQYALQDAARYERDCRGLAPTGGHQTELDLDLGA